MMNGRLSFSDRMKQVYRQTQQRLPFEKTPQLLGSWRLFRGLLLRASWHLTFNSAWYGHCSSKTRESCPESSIRQIKLLVHIGFFFFAIMKNIFAIIAISIHRFVGFNAGWQQKVPRQVRRTCPPSQNNGPRARSRDDGCRSWCIEILSCDVSECWSCQLDVGCLACWWRQPDGGWLACFVVAGSCKTTVATGKGDNRTRCPWKAKQRDCVHGMLRNWKRSSRSSHNHPRPLDPSLFS